MINKCQRCEGCGRIANSEDGEPWSWWESLPPGTDLAIRMGLVKPIPCPDCQGESDAAPELSDERYAP